MSRIFCGAILGWLVVATLHITARQPAGVPRSIGAAGSRVTTPKILPGTRPDVFVTIQGNALSSTNGSLSNANVRLRDARLGHIVDRQVTDKAGLFSFHAVDPGSYIVELISGDQSSVLAASQVLNAGAGETLSAVVKLPFRIPPVTVTGGWSNSNGSAAAVLAQAAASGVLATQASGTGTCDNLQ